MKRSVVSLLVLTLILLSAVSIASAQEGDMSEGQHWCFEGQPWGDGRCDDPDPWISDWHWTCGWYFAQTGGKSAPLWCRGEPQSGCYYDTGNGVGVLYNGEPNTEDNSGFYSDLNCTNGPLGFDTLVVAATQQEADAICRELYGPSSEAALLSDFGWYFGNEIIYGCLHVF